ncbi:MAG: hypothetical protein JJ908_11705 [Rhizobiales bacterium]|nr:hypothetical protein [Hyphomicrobiales bacterium]MBO6699489.1 hypothetical protein [Hyphomicrobiales bacterium]MBO6737027.1 hypothetical protein [Hyphomicrobiales bacterium]MBO6911899.1 hypothetical protein [Hyphomicrobiales bacterium]MBO6954835.1 hypothetical protein [Hyphomicrobiales bacterium]
MDVLSIKSSVASHVGVLAAIAKQRFRRRAFTRGWFGAWIAALALLEGSIF